MSPAIDDLSALTGRTFAAVLFDMDGTLIDSTPAVERTWLIMAERFGMTPEQLSHSHGVPAKQTLAEIVGPDELDEAVDWVEQLEIDDTEGVVPLPGAIEALTALDDATSAIATSCTRPLMEVRLVASGLPHPAVLVTASDVVTGKPDPAPFLLAASRLGVDPARCLVVEDAVSGLAAGVAAGCATLAVTTTYAAEDLVADAIVPDLASVRFRRVPGGVSIEPA